MRILNSLSLQGECAEVGECAERKLSTVGELQRILRIRRIYSSWLNKNSTSNMLTEINALGECAE
jgi:hypothetical protein